MPHTRAPLPHSATHIHTHTCTQICYVYELLAAVVGRLRFRPTTFHQIWSNKSQMCLFVWVWCVWGCVLRLCVCMNGFVKQQLQQHESSTKSFASSLAPHAPAARTTPLRHAPTGNTALITPIWHTLIKFLRANGHWPMACELLILSIKRQRANVNKHRRSPHSF